MTPRSAASIGFLLLAALGAPREVLGRVLPADPGAVSGQPNHYRTLVKALTPGDTLALPAGVYRDRLNLDGIQGTPEAWIVIIGPASGAPATITTESDCCNTVQLGGTAYVAIRNLTIDSAGLNAIDGINAKGAPTHDILIENCTLVGQGYDQGTIGISTKSPAWRWTIRGNRILEAGTGLYLGNSDGTQPFIGGLIEGNLIRNSIGYNMQIKHQLPYGSQAWMPQLPAGPHRTVIRHNVFIKEKNDWPANKLGGARPNLLVDPFPDSGPGSTDFYEIYGNLFYRNPEEALFQGAGRISLHDNVFLSSGAGQTSVVFAEHNGPVKVAHVYNNTIYSVNGGGIRFAAAPREAGAVVGNVIVTGGVWLRGPIPHSSGNLLGSVDDAFKYFAAPSESLGQADLYPKVDCPGCSGSPLAMPAFDGETDYDRDFNGAPKASFRYRGAYAGHGTNPGWRLQADRKPDVGPAGIGRTAAPDPPKDTRR